MVSLSENWRPEDLASTPLWMAGIYLLFGPFWIHVSDALLFLLVIDEDIHLWVETVKWTLFVLLSRVLVYWLVHRARRSRATARTQP